MITHDEYLDKVYGCWLGKCVAGTIGAPYEGMKQLLNIDFKKEMIDVMLPNDDLDLQVLWLKVLEEKGIYTSGDDLAEAFDKYNVYWPGEYAWFKKNYNRGIRPPYTAKYENLFYNEGMGCPIRAEIWGLICPGNPALAAKLCVMDGTLDHEGNSVFFEQFWAAMIAITFYESDIEKIIKEGMKYIPNDSRAYKLIEATCKFCKMYDDFRLVRSRLICDFGHSDCTNSFVNIGLTLMCLLKCENDPIKAAIMACNCGFDTDCTAGNSGALIGAIVGAKVLIDKYSFADSGYVLTLDYKRRSDKLWDLAVDTCKVGRHFMDCHQDGINFVEGGVAAKIDYKPNLVEILDFYNETPYIQPNQKVRVDFKVINKDNKSKLFEVKLKSPEGFFAEYPTRIEIGANAEKDFFVDVTMGDVEIIHEKNIFEISLIGTEKYSRTFGLVGKTPYEIYGPFWENNKDIKTEDIDDRYSFCFDSVDNTKFNDNLRFYHLNTTIDTKKEYMKVVDIFSQKRDPLRYETWGREVFCNGDIIEFDKVCPFLGTSVIYMYRTIICDNDRKIHIQIGRSMPYTLWINGKCILERHDCVNFTTENEHMYDVPLKKGENSIVIKICRINSDARLMFTMLEDRLCPPHIVDIKNKRRIGS